MSDKLSFITIFTLIFGLNILLKGESDDELPKLQSKLKEASSQEDSIKYIKRIAEIYLQKADDIKVNSENVSTNYKQLNFAVETYQQAFTYYNLLNKIYISNNDFRGAETTVAGINASMKGIAESHKRLGELCLKSSVNPLDKKGITDAKTFLNKSYTYYEKLKLYDSTIEKKQTDILHSLEKIEEVLSDTTSINLSDIQIKLELYGRVNFREGIADIYSKIARNSLKNNNIEQALSYTLQEISIREELVKGGNQSQSNKESLKNAYETAGDINRNNANFLTAKFYYNQLLKSEISESKQQLIHERLGDCSARLSEFLSASQSYQKSIDIIERLQYNPSKYLDLIRKKALADIQLKEYSTALAVLQKEQSIRNKYNLNSDAQAASLNSLLFIADLELKSINSAQDVKRNDREKTRIKEFYIKNNIELDTNYINAVNSLAAHLIQYNPPVYFKTAEPLYQEVYKLTSETNSKFKKINPKALKNLLDLYYAMNDKDKASKLINETNEYKDFENQSDLVTGTLNKYERINAENILKKKVIESLRKDSIITALSNFKLQSEKNGLIKDSVISAGRVSNLKSDSIIKQSIVTSLEKEATIKTQTIIILIITLSGIIVIIFVILIRYKEKKKLNNLLTDKNTELTGLNEQKDKLLKVINNQIERASEYVISILPEPIKKGNPKVTWKFVPSEELGGDSFGYHWIDENNLAVYLLDVCGHGVGSALLSISAVNTLKFQTLPNCDFKNPVDVLAGLNTAYQMSEHNGMFFTIWYAVFNKEEKTLSYSSAGHHSALMITSGEKPSYLDCRNLVIGAAPEYPFISETITIEKPSSIYVFSDGAYEIKKTDGNMMTINEMADIILKNQKDDGSEIEILYDTLLNITRQHDEQKLPDDYSMLKLRVE